MRNFSHMTRCSSCRRRWPRDRSGLRQQNARQMRSKGALPRHFWTIYAAFCSAAVTTSVYAKGFDTALTFVCTFQHWHMTLCTHAPQHQQFQIRWSALLLPGAPLQGALQPPPQCWPPCYRTLQPALVAAHLPQMAPALQVLRLDALHSRHARPCIATSLPTSGSDRRPAHL